jgi:hypothetical protein
MPHQLLNGVPFRRRKKGGASARRPFHVSAALFAFGTPRPIPLLRPTAIRMRIILSEGQVNIFNLAKNAGTSVEQIERFYARNLPLSKEMAKNLQSFGSG